MKPWIIVGGGFTGLIVARILKSRGMNFIGLEKSEHLGGSASIGHQRVYEPGSVEFFRQQFPELEFDFIDENPLERRKGEWRAPEEEGLVSEEKFYLRGGFYSPKRSYAKLGDQLANEVGEFFHLRVSVTEIRPETKLLVCSNGNEIEYEKIVWCSPLETLPKVWTGDKTPLLKPVKELEDAPRGLMLEMETTAPLFPYKNTVVFPFRYKDSRLRALGTSKPSEEGAGTHILQWVLVLEQELADDREELAKVMRTLKRELLKEFEGLKELLKGERIVYLPKASDEAPATVKSLALLPDVIYVGSQVRLPQSKEEPRNLDRALDNCHFFMDLVAAQTPA